LSVRLTISSLDRQPDKRAREFWPGIAAVSEDPFQARIFPQGPLDQTAGTVAILDICRDYLVEWRITRPADGELLRSCCYRLPFF
jgi:hypothetical protein